MAQRASVGSTEAAKDVVARFGRIDRRIGEPPCARRCVGPKRAGGMKGDSPRPLPMAVLR